jgi:hypothetical protein
MREAAMAAFAKSWRREWGSDKPCGPGCRLDSERPRRLKRIKALHWQTPARDSFDQQRLSSAVANSIRHLLRVASADRPIVGTTSEPDSPFSSPHPLTIFSTRIWETNQIFAHIENKSAETESTMTFKPGVSGNPGGNRHHTRHLLNHRFLQALLLDFDAHGREAIEKCRKQSALGYVKVLAHLVPREMKVEQSQIVKSMSDEELEATIEYIRSILAAQAGEGAKVIEGPAETVALPAPKRPNRLMMEADTAVGPKDRKPRQHKVPSPASA